MFIGYYRKDSQEQIVYITEYNIVGKKIELERYIV